ncbi:MAG TPA: carboxymuconolactone decarboxylase family protein [Paenibacillus sp.]|nr:carboxymuconolactone decarboxylase family protein [Paenibacillus sp.]
MKLRMNWREANPAAMQAMLQLEGFIAKSGLDRGMYELIKVRASQLNGCSFCIDMHAQELLKEEPPERVYLLPVWREVPYYSDKERAVLAFTEAVTLVSDRGVPEKVYEEIRKHYEEKEIVDLILAINTINAWNRLAIATGMFPRVMGPAGK